MPEPRRALLELTGLGLAAGSLVLLDDISLRLEPGSTTVVMGPAGSGKTSLVKAAAGLLLPDRGTVRFEGRSLATLSRREALDFRKRSGFVFQDAALWANQSLFDNVAFPLRFHHPSTSTGEVEGAVALAIEAAGYSRSLKLRPSDISAGERRMIGVARALVLDPELLFLDDPFSDLDEEARYHLSLLLVGLRKRGRTVFLTGATPGLANKVADRVILIDKGRIQAQGSYEEAVAWPPGRGLPGRLIPRRSPGGLVGAWEDALADEGRRGRPAGSAAEDS